jgi:hypothetical protein
LKNQISFIKLSLFLSTENEIYNGKNGEKLVVLKQLFYGQLALPND